MRTARISLVAAVAAICAFTANAFAHLDTLTQIQNPPPLVKEIEAESCPGVAPNLLVKDARALGGVAVRTAPHTPVFQLDFGNLDRGIYVVYVIGKVTEDSAWVKNKERKELRPLNIALRVTQPDGKQAFWSVRAAFDTDYEDLTHIYFQAPASGRYRAELYVDDRSEAHPLIDRIQLRNPLQPCDWEPVKAKRVLYTDEQVARMRAAATHANPDLDKLKMQPRTAAERAQRDDILWNAVMPLNANLAGSQLYHGIERGHDADRKVIQEKAEKLAGRDIGKWEFPGAKSYDTPYELVNKTLNLRYTLADYNANRPLPKPWPIPEDKGAYFYDQDVWKTSESFNFGTVPATMRSRYQQVVRAIGAGYDGLVAAARARAGSDLITRYLLTNDPEAAADAAMLLAAYAYRYPGYDFRAHCMLNIYYVFRRFSPGGAAGRGPGYKGWSTPEVCKLLESYDALFPYIKGNQELAQRIGRFVPWVKTPDDVVMLLDTYLVQRAGLDGIDQTLYSNATPNAAVVLGPNAVSKKFLDTYFSGIYLRNGMTGFPDDIINGYSRDGLNYIGSTFYTQGESAEEMGANIDLLATYVRAGGDPKFNVNDPKRYPRIAALPGSLFDLYVAGGYGSNIGDVAAPDYQRLLNPDPKRFDALFRRAWRQQQDPRYAWLLANRIGQGDTPDDEWAEIVKVAKDTPDPFLHQQSRVLGGFGMAVMEDGGDNPDFRQKRTVTIRTGVASGHAQGDSLDLQFYAHGLRMLSDLGGRVSGQYGKPTCMSTYVHNVVEIDEKGNNGGTFNSTATAWVNAFKPTPGAQFTLASARAESQPDVSLYRRGTALISVDEGGDGKSANAYVFDVFRVHGGKVHTWCFKGCPPDEFAVNSPLDPATSETALRYLAKHRPSSQQEGTAADTVEATWRLRRRQDTVTIGDKTMTLGNAEQKMLRKDYDPDSPQKYTRATIFGHGGDKLLIGNWYCTAFKGREFDWPFLYIRQDGLGESTWPAIVEAYVGEPYLAGKRLLKVDRGDRLNTLLSPVAIEVKTTNGYTDVLYSGVNADPRAVEGGISASGEFAFLRRDKTGVVAAELVGGRELVAADVALRPAMPERRGAILDADYGNMQFTVSGSWPASAVVGQELFISNGRHDTSCRVVAAEPVGANTRITFAKSAVLFQGGVEHLDVETGAATLDLPPSLYDYHRLYYEGMTAVNEAGKPVGHVRVSLGDRFMYLGWPEWHRHLQKMSIADIPDADGDGKHTLRMYAADKTAYRKDDDSIGWKQPGDFMLALDVTRVGDDGLRFWYKQHPLAFLDALKMPHRGWPYYRQVLKNENGDKVWESGFPGDTYQFSIDGRNLTPADLPDTDGNGRVMVRFCDFGPGDTVTLPTSVSLRRQADGSYTMRADIAVEVTVQGHSAKLDEAALANGPAVLAR